MSISARSNRLYALEDCERILATRAQRHDEVISIDADLLAAVVEIAQEARVWGA